MRRSTQKNKKPKKLCAQGKEMRVYLKKAKKCLKFLRRYTIRALRHEQKQTIDIPDALSTYIRIST